MGHEIKIFSQSNSNMYQISLLNEHKGKALTPDTRHQTPYKQMVRNSGHWKL